MPPSFAIGIGGYRLKGFILLNIRACRDVFGQDVPVLVSDDHSQESSAIRQIAAEEGCHYIVSDKRRSHFAGDVAALMNSIEFGDQMGCDVSIKISQRVIPCKGFKEAAGEAFADPDVHMAVPAQLPVATIARHQTKFYSTFSLLSDVVAIRRGAISAQELMDVYRDRIANPKSKLDSLVEATVDSMRQNHKTALVKCWSSWGINEAKACLRKCQSSVREYIERAKELGLTDLKPSDLPLDEWIAMESRAHYLAKPKIA
jgi:hypothetical protein